MSVDRRSSSFACTILRTAIATVAIVVTSLDSVAAPPSAATPTLDTDWLNFKAPVNLVQLGIFNEDSVATLQGATFSATDRTGIQIAQGPLTPLPPGSSDIVSFTVASTGPGPGAVITIHIPANFNSCNLNPILVVTPSTTTGPVLVDQFSGETFSRFNAGGQPINCQAQSHGKGGGSARGAAIAAISPGMVYSPPSTSQSTSDQWLDIHNITLVPQTYTFGIYNPAVAQIESSQQTTVGPNQVVKVPVTLNGFGVPFVCGDGSLVSPNFTLQQIVFVGSQTQEQLDQRPESDWRLYRPGPQDTIGSWCLGQ